MKKELEKKLKPCPFCGGRAMIDIRYREWDGKLYLVIFVICIDCGCSTKDFRWNDKWEEVEEVIQAWNRRV